MGASLYGYTHLYGGLPGGQAEYLCAEQAQYSLIKVPDGGIADERYLFLSDVLPTAWQAVTYADTPTGETLAVCGLGPIGQMCVRVAKPHGVERVLAIDYVPERLRLADEWGAEMLDLEDIDDATAAVIERTAGRGADSVIDAVGMEAEGSRAARALQFLEAEARPAHGAWSSPRAGDLLFWRAALRASDWWASRRRETRSHSSRFARGRSTRKVRSPPTGSGAATGSRSPAGAGSRPSSAPSTTTTRCTRLRSR
jgi:threonine dehydrogenase-like Zn-dependent dehydrogenase